MKTYKELRALCMSYAPIEINGEYYYHEQTVLSMLKEVCKELNIEVEK